MTQAIFSVIADQWRVVFGILLLIILSQALTGAALRIIFGNQLTSSEYLSLSLAGWILPVSLLSLAYFLGGFEHSLLFNLFLLMSLIGILIFFRLRPKPHPSTGSGHRPEPDSKPTAFFLLLFFSISVLLRLAFVSKAILPSYFDSAQHYLLIKIILGNGTTELLTSLTTSYYHLGYHFLTVFITSTLHTEITKTMLILGQMVLAVLPITTFFLIKHETRSNIAGIFAVSLSAFGWYMPAHAVDWGKYPALTSLGLIPFILSLAYLLSQKKNIVSPKKQRVLYLLLGAGILVSGFVHSRSLVIFGITFITWIIAAWRQKLPQAQQVFIFFMVLISIALEIIVIQKQDVLALVFDPYINKGILITVLIMFLSIFAQRKHPQLTFTCTLVVCFLLGSLFIPVPGLIPGRANLTLLDRPFVETILFLPLALLGGLGLAGFLSSLRGGHFLFTTKQSSVARRLLRAKNTPALAGGARESALATTWLFYFFRLERRASPLCGFTQHDTTSIFIQTLVIGLVFINAFAAYDLYPSDCCVIAGHDDVAAMDWMDAQLPMNARFGISATELKVLASESFEGYVGGDAGIWITPLINRVTIPLPYNSNFDEQAVLDRICQMSISHIYVGETGQTFDDSQLNAQPAWYKILLSMPRVKVYQVVGCNGVQG